MVGLFILSIPTWAQDASDEDMFSLSLEELMNIPINSASKKSETLFDAPLSSYTITKAEIDKAGSTSIMEALRLAPGVIVREQTNGVYDIHIRGFDNLTRTAGISDKTSTTALVMIDNRPVFNHNLGGTAWEALPVDLNDVERIEIVRGPSAPLFGPNAVTGVINIITKKASEGTYANASVQYGTPNTFIANGSFGQNVNDKFSFGLSVNYQEREKFDDTYFQNNVEGFYTLDQLDQLVGPGLPPFVNSFSSMYPNPETSMRKYGANAIVSLNVTENISFDLSAGLQDAEAQKIFLGGIFNGMHFTTNTTKTQYVNLAGKVHGFAFRGSYLNGEDDLSFNQSPDKYDYKIADINGEYTFTIGENASIVPGISYQDVAYNDINYTTEGFVFLNGTEQSISTFAGFVRSDFHIVKDWRVIAALRVDKFSSHDDAYLAYEFATTYKIGEKNLVRAAITRSNSGSFIGNNYLNFRLPDAGGPGADLVRSGNENLDLFTIDMIEVGFRTKLSTSVQMDIDVFHQKAENLSTILNTNALLQEFGNVPTTATQIGSTLSFNIVPTEKWQIKPFLTIQSTETQLLPSNFNNPAADPTITYSDSKHESTPTIFGGYYVNYQPISKLNINVNGYFFGNQTQYDDNFTAEAGDIKSKFLLNAKVGYNLTSQFNVYLNARNAFNSDSREYFAGDRIGALYMVGASFNLK